MATLKNAIYKLLSDDSTVNTLTNGSITPGGDPVRNTTSVTYHKISSGRGHTMDGPDTLAIPIFQVNSFSETDANAETLSDAVRAVLDGFSGTVSGLDISYCALQDESDLDDYEPGNRKVSRHGVRQDYRITYTEQ